METIRMLQICGMYSTYFVCIYHAHIDCIKRSVGVIAYVMVFGFPPFYVDPNKYHGVKETKEIYKLILKGFDPNVKVNYAYSHIHRQNIYKRMCVACT